MVLLLCGCNTKPPSIKDPDLSKELSVVTDSILQLITTYHYNPDEVQDTAYLDLKKQMMTLTNDAQSKEEFVEEFNALWLNGPFSHVRLSKLERRAEEMANYIDSLIAGEEAVSLDWEDSTAILSVNTMSGMDTKDRIFEAYKRIRDQQASSLIIDLRNNTGGTFAGVPLIGHLLNDSIDAGVFVSRKWWNNNDRAPIVKDIEVVNPWLGWSIRSFWKDVQEQPLTRIKLGPYQPHFDGKVFVLTSIKTASAAEFTVDALAQLEKVTIIGETTSGEMLSQKMFDLPYNYQIALPIAEYYSFNGGRIEGEGVTPDMEINQALALDLATALANGTPKEEALAKIELEMEKLNNTPLKGEVLYVMGSMNNWGQNQKDTPQFTYKGDGIYESTIILKSGKYEFKIAPLGWKFDYGARPKKDLVEIGAKTALLRQAGSRNLRLHVKDESELIFSLQVKNPMEVELSVLKK